ncbi:MAG: hypothetical protein JXN63_03695 [Candidatus Delongbacteria bacterium]|nr:hypothetical protein [Candidatus Delongbacteria bacterium]
MKDILKELTRGIRINRKVLDEIKKSKATLEYVKTQNFETMPEPVKEMHLKMIESANNTINEAKDDLIIFEENYEGDDAVGYAERFNRMNDIKDYHDDLESLKRIMGSEDLNITDNLRKELERIRSEKEEFLLSIKEDLKKFVLDTVKSEFLNEESREKNIAENIQEPPKPKKRDYTVRKSGKSPAEIKELLEQYIEVNEAIFNKIIFESKPPTLSITERVLEVNFRQGTGYVVNFISEPDTNYGKFYKNLLNVFNEIKEYMFDNYDIVVVPEEGKNISYLNSFYQNYVFVREKIDTALTQFKLQNSLLNENFSVNYMVFEKISGKYLIFFNGNKSLSKAVEGYFQNQARLGTMTFELEFVEYNESLKKIVRDRYSKIINKIDLLEENNHMDITEYSDNEGHRSVVIDITGVKILIDPETEIGSGDIDIVVMSNARGKHVNLIPKIMRDNPNAKLFTSDISFKIARIKWFKELNNPNIVLTASGENSEFSRQDIDNINERVIRITPEGKGYNFKGVVNIKFFNSGVIPGSSAVEIRDASRKTIYLGNYSTEDSGLMTGAETDICEYDHAVFNSGEIHDVEPLPVSLIRERLNENKQVFIFCDSVGNLQHVAVELYQAGINKPVIAGEASFTIINKELSKLLNFGSSWGDYFQDKELFDKSVLKIEPFSDEYEFYKKFSMSESGIFILPFEKTEIDMVLKNKLYGSNLILVPSMNENIFVSMLENDPMIPDEHRTGKHLPYNYIINISPEQLLEKIRPCKKPVSVLMTGPFSFKDAKFTELKTGETKKVY